MSAKLYVGNLPETVCEKDLAEMFSAMGEVIGAKIGMERDWGSLHTCGWVVMRDAESAARAMQFLDGRAFFGQHMVVKRARRLAHKHNLLH